MIYSIMLITFKTLRDEGPRNFFIVITFSKAFSASMKATHVSKYLYVISEKALQDTNCNNYN